MDRLYRAGTAYTGLVDLGDAPPKAHRGSWRGRKVSAQQRLDDAEKGPVKGAVEELEQRLQERFGDYIPTEVMGSIAPDTNLTQRTVSILESRAQNLLNRVQRSNKQQLKIWIKDESSGGLVAEQFELITGYHWSAVSQHERRLMIDQVRTVLAQTDIMLTREIASDLTHDYLQHHQSLFTRYSPETTAILQEFTGLEPPILSGHLPVWAKTEQESHDGELSDNDMQLVNNFYALSNQAIAIVTSSSLEDSLAMSVQKQIKAVNQLSINLAQCSHQIRKYAIDLPSGLREAMVNDLGSQLEAVNAYKRQLEVNEAGNPFRLEKWQELKRIELGAAHQFIADELGDLETAEQIRPLSRAESNKKQKMNVVFTEIEALTGELLAGSDNANSLINGVLNKHKPIKSAELYQQRVVDLLTRAGIKKSVAVARMNDYRAHILTFYGWTPIEKEMVVQIDRKGYNCKSIITPACCLRLDLEEREEGQYDVFSTQYGGAGRPSTARTESEHAVNLNETKLMVNGEEQFRGLRSATLTAYGIKNTEERKKASLNRARELIVAAVRVQLDRNDDLKQAALDGEVIPVNLFSASLLTPDLMRHITHIHEDEYAMQEEQVRALREVSQEIKESGGVEITESNGKQRKITVNLNLITCNFGVNKLSLGSLPRRILGAWQAAEDENAKALDDLFGSTRAGEKMDGWVRVYLDDEHVEEEDKLLVIELVEQIRHIYTTESYKQEGEDAYGMVERLQLLAYKIGAIPHMNCKSGKDRTGEADAAIKRFATQVAITGVVPDPDLPATREEQVLAQQFINGTGNLELQQKNLNIPGFKNTTGKKQLGQPVYSMTHRS